MFSQSEKPKFGTSNPALKEDHEPLGTELLQWAVGLVVTILVIYWLIGFAANIMARRISDEQERKWFSGDKIYSIAGFESQSGEENADFIRCKELLVKLRSAQKLRNLPYDLHYSSNTLPNAFAAPGGSLMVTKGLLDLVRTDMGLAMVLGHELGHHQYRDPLRGMGRSLLLSLVASILMGGGSNLVQIIFDLADSSYSRDQELRADEFGFRLVHSTFYKTEGALEFFEKMASQDAGQLEKFASMMSTHPYTPDRLAKLKELEKSMIRMRGTK